MSKLFLSHSSANNAQAVAIRDWLREEGWTDVFLDVDPDPEVGIPAGERWERALNQAASRCEAILFLVSQAWLDSRWCNNEFNLARRLNKRLFGALIEDIAIDKLPTDLTGTWQIVDLASGRDHRMFRVVLPRTHAEQHVTFSREGLSRLRSGLAKSGIEPRFFAWPPEKEPKRAPPRPQTARGRRRRHLLRARGPDPRSARCAARLTRCGGAAAIRHSRRLRRRKIVVPARRIIAAAGARRPAFPDAAGDPPRTQRRDRRGKRTAACP